jgi:hypothetical protein
MRRIFLVFVAALAWSYLLPVATADELSGKWSGPWYRGMTSGIMMLDMDEEGNGMVQFTNLDNFGVDSVPVSTKKKDSKSLKFSAAGEGAAVFTATARLADGGKLLKGKGEYDGFAIEFKLKHR